MHHSHTHANSIGVDGTAVTDHGSVYVTGVDCDLVTAIHYHEMIYDFESAHIHDWTLITDAANLGTPWWNHTHLLTSSIVGLGGSAHVHTITSCDYAYCTICRYHGHYHNIGSLADTSGGAAHNNHSTSSASGTADPAGTPENHRHIVNFISGQGGAHNHVCSGYSDYGLCYKNNNHRHQAPNTLPTAEHNHTISGYTGYGGEAPPVTAVTRGDGLTWIIAQAQLRKNPLSFKVTPRFPPLVIRQL